MLQKNLNVSSIYEKQIKIHYGATYFSIEES